MVKSPYNCVIYPMTWPQVANQQQQKKKERESVPHSPSHHTLINTLLNVRKRFKAVLHTKNTLKTTPYSEIFKFVWSSSFCQNFSFLQKSFIFTIIMPGRTRIMIRQKIASKKIVSKKICLQENVRAYFGTLLFKNFVFQNNWFKSLNLLVFM